MSKDFTGQPPTRGAGVKGLKTWTAGLFILKGFVVFVLSTLLFVFSIPMNLIESALCKMRQNVLLGFMNHFPISLELAQTLSKAVILSNILKIFYTSMSAAHS